MTNAGMDTVYRLTRLRLLRIGLPSVVFVVLVLVGLGWFTPRDPAIIAATRAQDLVTVVELLASGANVDDRDFEGRSALWHATKAGDITLMSALLQAGADPNYAQDGESTSPLLVAAMEGHVTACLLLLEHGASPAHGGKGETKPWAMAVLFGHDDIARVLIEHGAADGDASALHGAARFNRSGLIQRLLDRGADPNARNTSGMTPLHSAVYSNQTEAIESLLRAGADRSVRDFQGRTAYDLAVRIGADKCALLLKP